MKYIRQLTSDTNRLSSLGDAIVFAVSSMVGIYLLAGMIFPA
ncbi:hypothetical protein [Leeia speluncae]|nr:hypothetical protein [Leeia speluncae]